VFKQSACAWVALWARPVTFAGRGEVLARAPNPGPAHSVVGRRTPSGRQVFTAAQLLALLFLGCTRAVAACIDPAALTHSTISIARHFDAEERKAETGVLGIRGTAWFLSPTSIATAGHVASAMKLSQQTWKDIEILDGENTQPIAVRVLHLAGAHFEKIAVLELRTAFPGGRSLKIRTEPLVPEEPVVSLAYPKNRLRFAGGRFVEYGGGDKFAGTALLEMYDGDDRLVLDHGASGAPVLDCEGRVVALVSNLFTQTMQFFSHPIRISTAWGTANVVSVPIQVLKGAVKEE
jgi:Trypsin-like peptidase domain